MSLEQLKDSVTHLPADQQRELVAFIISLQTERDDSFRAELARKIDDKDPAHWVDLEELPKKAAE